MKLVNKTIKEIVYAIELTQDELDIITSVLGANTSHIGYDLYSELNDAGGDENKYRVTRNGREDSYELFRA